MGFRTAQTSLNTVLENIIYSSCSIILGVCIQLISEYRLDFSMLLTIRLRIINELLARHVGKTLEEIDQATSYDNYMNAEESVKFGICDDISVDIF